MHSFHEIIIKFEFIFQSLQHNFDETSFVKMNLFFFI